MFLFYNPSPENRVSDNGHKSHRPLSIMDYIELRESETTFVY